MNAVLFYRDTDNPLGIPGDYPAITKPLKDGEKVEAPWVEMRDAELQELIRSMSPQVDAIFKARADSEKASEHSKLDTLKRLFDEGKVIRDAWPGLTNSQKLDLLPIVFDLLFKQRRQILDQYRPE